MHCQAPGSSLLVEKHGSSQQLSAASQQHPNVYSVLSPLCEAAHLTKGTHRNALSKHLSFDKTRPFSPETFAPGYRSKNKTFSSSRQDTRMRKNTSFSGSKAVAGSGSALPCTRSEPDTASSYAQSLSFSSLTAQHPLSPTTSNVGTTSPTLSPSGAPAAPKRSSSSDVRRYHARFFSLEKKLERSQSVDITSEKCCDMRGRPPPRKRWRLYCFRFVFVIEPNIPRMGIRYRYRSYGLTQTFEESSVCCGISAENLPSEAGQDPPQLIIFRYSETVAEVRNGMHQLYSQFGPLECLFYIDCLVGCLRIAQLRFLVVVDDSEGVAGFRRNSFASTDSQQRTSADQVKQGAALDAFIYRIKRAYLIPYHVPLEQYSEMCPPPHFSTNWAVREVPGSAALPADMFFDKRSDFLTRDLEPQMSPVNVLSDRYDDTQGQMTRDLPLKKTYNYYSGNQKQNIATGNAEPRRGFTASDSEVSCRLETSKRLKPKRNVLPYSSDFHNPPILVSCLAWSEFGSFRVNDVLGDKIALFKRNIERLLSTSFYFSYDIEITHTLQRKRLLGIPLSAQGWPCDYVERTAFRKTKRKVVVDLLGDLESLENEETDDKEDETSAAEAQRPGVRFVDIADKRFVWNLQLAQSLLSWSIDSRWLVPIIQGSVTSATVVSGIHGLDVVLLCRRSWCRAGTRYTHRGIDDSGNVANFNESEQLVAACRVNPETSEVVYRGTNIAGGGWASFVQIRGSVPLFWEQTSSLTINPVPQLTRQVAFAVKAFTMHQTQLYRYYGRICYVDLLSTTKGGEHKLSSSLQSVIDQFNAAEQKNATTEGETSVCDETTDLPSRASLIQSDFHQQIKANGFEKALANIVEMLRPYLHEFGYYCEKPMYTERPVFKYQKGCVRTNCLDCLDRTNVFQWYLCWSWISQYLKERGLRVFLTPGIRGTVSGPSTWAQDANTTWSNTNRNEVNTLANEAVNVNPQAPPPPGGQSAPRPSPASEVLRVNYFGGEEGAVSWSYQLLRSRLVTAKHRRSPEQSLSPMPHTRPADPLAGEFCSSVLKDIIARIWADHGDHISKAYTGTVSVMSSLLRQGKSSLATNMVHMMTSLGRFYQNTFEDSARQDAIELLLSQHDSLSQTMAEYSGNNGAPQTVFDTTTPLLTPVPSLFSVERDEALARSLQNLSPPATQRRYSGLPTTLEQLFAPRDTTPEPRNVRTLRLWFGTWNLGGRFVPEPFERWLFYKRSSSHTDPLLLKEEQADVYVVAVQELVELTKVRVLLSQSDREKEGQLELNIKQTLGPDYIMLKSHSLVGLHLSVFVKSSLKHHVAQVHTSDVKLGFKGQMGNKGAVFLRLLLGDVSFCFVNVHLSSGAEKARQRRDQLQTILDSVFQTRRSLRVQQHDCVFLGGDFNFRCNASPQETLNWIKSGQWNELLFRDQFIVGKRLQLPPFRDVCESAIHFMPTYKFLKGTNQFDEGRSPGWCDRVLYTGEFSKETTSAAHGGPRPPPLIKCTEYNSVPEFLSSDHKPVYAIFHVPVTVPVNDPLGVCKATPLSSERDRQRQPPSVQHSDGGASSNSALQWLQCTPSDAVSLPQCVDESSSLENSKASSCLTIPSISFHQKASIKNTKLSPLSAVSSLSPSEYASFCYAPFQNSYSDAFSRTTKDQSLNWAHTPWPSLSSTFSSYPVPPPRSPTVKLQHPSLQSSFSSPGAAAHTRPTVKISNSGYSKPHASSSDPNFSKTPATPDAETPFTTRVVLPYDGPKRTPIQSTVSPPSLLSDISGATLNDPVKLSSSSKHSHHGPFMPPHRTDLYCSPAPSPPSLLEE